jgi:hypothetical protein
MMTAMNAQDHMQKVFKTMQGWSHTLWTHFNYTQKRKNQSAGRAFNQHITWWYLYRGSQFPSPIALVFFSALA